MNRALVGLALGLVACGGQTVALPAGQVDAGSAIDASAVDATTFDASPADVGSPIPDWKICTGTPECSIASTTCCGVCGGPSLKDVTGVKTAAASAFHESLCTPPSNCPKCAQTTNANLLASCKSQSCEAFDVSTSSYASCKSNADCSVQHTACCSCQTDDYVAVNATFASYIDEADPTCKLKDCVGCTAPPSVRASCSSTGFCVLEK